MKRAHPADNPTNARPVMPRSGTGMRWALAELARRAGAREIEELTRESTPSVRADGFTIRYGLPEDGSASTPRCLWIVPSSDRAVAGLMGDDPHAVRWRPAREVLPPDIRPVWPDDTSIPFPLVDGRSLDDGPVRRTSEGIVLRMDLAATALFMLSRWEETVLPDRDEHDRFPAAASAALRHGFLHRPVVDEHALILRAWMQQLDPDWRPALRSFDVRVSHDIDRVRPFRSIPAGLRRVAGDVLRRRRPRMALQSMRDLAFQHVDLGRTSWYRGIEELADLAERHRVPATFFFQVDHRGPLDGDYDILRSPMRDMVVALAAAGHDIGLHPGYRALGDRGRLGWELDRLRAVSPHPVRLSRHHYLRFRVPETWRGLADIGIERDLTLGYADHEGFRCGTCHPYRPFDIAADEALDIVEEPLVVMETTLRSYRGLPVSDAEDRIMMLTHHCRRVGGRMTVLWHNSKLHGDWEPWGRMYRRILAQMAQLRDTDAG